VLGRSFSHWVMESSLVLLSTTSLGNFPVMLLTQDLIFICSYILCDREAIVYLRVHLGHYFMEPGDWYTLKGWNSGGCSLDHWRSWCKGLFRCTPYASIHICSFHEVGLCSKTECIRRQSSYLPAHYVFFFCLKLVSV
jgi:hypothetical protein